MTNLRKFVDEEREDGEESLAAQAEDQLEMEKELYRLIRLIDQCRSDERTGTLQCCCKVISMVCLENQVLTS